MDPLHFLPEEGASAPFSVIRIFCTARIGVRCQMPEFISEVQIAYTGRFLCFYILFRKLKNQAVFFLLF